MFEIEKLGPILKPTENLFENKTVLNPGVYQEGEGKEVILGFREK